MYYGLLGEHLSHSYSPLIHSMLGDYEYRLIEKAPEDVEDFIRNGDFGAINITIPYKKAVIPYLDELSERAEKIGSVNVVVRRPDGTLFGDNSDYGGFASLVRKSKIRIKGKKVIVLGDGGASLTVQTVLRDMGAANVTVISLFTEDNYENIDKHADADVIVNATPVGMYPKCGERLVDISAFPRLSGVIDVIYNPQKTAFVLDAEERGIPAFGGLHMLVAQAVVAYEMFFSCKAEPGITDKIERKISAMMKNVTLIGMPGCGKTSVGKRIAALTGREFIDIDDEIVKEAGKSIPEIFAEDGEDAFRRIETSVTARVCQKSGCIISTGGGVVTRPENRRHLWQNSTVVYVHRELSALATEGRPLSGERGVWALAKERMPLYKDYSHIKVLNTGVNETAWEIIRNLHLQVKRGK